MSGGGFKSPESGETSESPGGQQGGREKICKVCGDKALGYNFNAITCESCKAFFRRNALKNKEFKCPFNKKCDINPVTRRFCQLCRLLKCFEIGMRKEYIMSEDDKREKRKKIEENRANKRKDCDGGAGSEPKRKLARTSADDDDCDREDVTGEDAESDEEEREDEVEEEYGGEDGGKRFKPVGGTPRKTCTGKRVRYNSSSDPSLPFPSPGLPETSSPDSVTVTESRTADAFDETPQDVPGRRCLTREVTSQSRSAEIYRMSRSTGDRTGAAGSDPADEKTYTDSNIIRIILDSEFSKSSEVAVNSTVGRTEGMAGDEDGLCNFRERSGRAPGGGGGGEYVISEADILELAKNNRNILLESSTRDGKRVLMIGSKGDGGRGGKGTVWSGGEGRGRGDGGSGGYLEGREDGTTPLLSSLVRSRRSSEGGGRSPPSKPVAEDIFQDIPRTSTLCLTNSIDSILSEAIKLEYEAYTSMNSRVNNSRELNDAERAKLNELIVANKALLAPLEDDLSPGDDFGFNVNAIAGCGPSVLVDVLNLTAVAIRRLIKMSKKINAFKNMCQDDQIALLKGGCTEMMILRSAMTYDPDRDSWKIPQSKEKLMNIKVDILKEAGGRVFEEHQRFLQTFDPKWRNDENIMLILSAIALFTPDRPRAVHYDVIKLEQNSYYYLLRRYLESVYQGCEARLTFLKLIHKISELHKLNEDHVRVYLDANPREIEPLLIEIFDLKPH